MDDEYNEYKEDILNLDTTKKFKFISNEKYHYVYKIINNVSKMIYIGSRTCKCDPILDLGVQYFSSSADKKFMNDQRINPNLFSYIVLKVFDNPDDKIIFESFLHRKYDVRNNINYLNLSNQTPFTFFISDESRGKAQKTKNEIGIDGLTGHERIGKSISKSLKIRGVDGLTVHQRSSIKSNITKKVRDKNGLTIIDKSKIKFKKTISKIQKSGLTKAKEIGLKGAKTRNIPDEFGMTPNMKLGIKSNKTRNIPDKVGITINQYNGINQQGLNNPMYKGKYITPWGIYDTALIASNRTNISRNTVYRYCKFDIIISKKAYSQIPVLKKLGTEDDIIGKTSTEVGFKFDEI